MTKRMEEILKWYKDMLYVQKREIHDLKKEIKKLKEKDLINKIDELATTDKSSTVDWQVGDRICAHYHIDTIPNDGELKRYLSILSDPRWTTPLNISAALRAKDKEIAELQKVQKECRKNAERMQKDPWCYDMDKAPHKTMLLLTDGTSYSVGEKYIDVAGNNRLMPYDHYTLDDEPEAWMPIPEPKGVDN